MYQLGRPVYKQENGNMYIAVCCVSLSYRVVILSGASGRWLISDDYTEYRGGLANVEDGRVEILGLRWKYSNSGWKDDDNTLKVQ